MVLASSHVWTWSKDFNWVSSTRKEKNRKWVFGYYCCWKFIIQSIAWTFWRRKKWKREDTEPEKKDLDDMFVHAVDLHTKFRRLFLLLLQKMISESNLFTFFRTNACFRSNFLSLSLALLAQCHVTIAMPGYKQLTRKKTVFL